MTIYAITDSHAAATLDAETYAALENGDEHNLTAADVARDWTAYESVREAALALAAAGGWIINEDGHTSWVAPENPTAGSGQHSHPVPALEGVVVEIRDGQHDGTAVWRRDHDRLPYVLASYDSGEVRFAERCVLVVGQDVDAIPEPCGVDLDSPRGLALVGIDTDDDLSWLTEGAEVLWDSVVED